MNIRTVMNELGPEEVILRLVKLSAKLKEDYDYVSVAFLGMANANSVLIDGLQELDCAFGQDRCDGDMCPRCHALNSANAVMSEFHQEDGSPVAVA